jgi:hypothetical protein
MNGSGTTHIAEVLTTFLPVEKPAWSRFEMIAGRARQLK